MSGESPDVVLFDGYYGQPLAVQNATPIPANTAAILSAGSDGTNARYLTVKAPSTLTATTDPALVVGISPNSNGVNTSGSISGNGNVLALPGGSIITLLPYVGATFEVSGTWSGVLTLQGSNGGSFYQIDVISISNPSNVPQATITANGLYYAPLACVSMQLVMSSYVSGTVNVYCSLHTEAIELVNSTTVTALQDTSYFPNPTNVVGAPGPLNIDPSGNLAIRGAVTTDELGFRDSFQGSGLTTALTGTLTFVNGSTAVTGTGTTFTTQIVEGQYIKLTSDSETAYAQVFSVISNTSLTLVSGYTGTSSTAASVVSNWATTTGSGATIAVSNSNLTITNGTGSGTTTHVQKLIDYAPLQMFCVTQYTYGTGTGQYAFFGFQDNPASPQAQVIVEIDASLATNQVRFISSITSAANETINQIFTLPYGMLNTQQLQYKITVTQTSTTLEAATPNTNMSAVVATVTTHMPPPYVSMYAVAGITNTAAVTASGVLSTDVIYINNQDRVETALSFTGEPITTVNATDLQPSAVTITAQDTGSTSTALSDGQIFVTGTPTANSFAQYNTISAETIRIQVTGTWTGNLVVEKSLDGGITWVPDNVHLVGTAVITNNFTSNFLGGMNCSGTSLVRVRSTLAWTGTATVKVITSVNVDVVFVGNEQASQLSSNSYPNPVAYISGTDTPTVDAYGNLEIRGPVITDEGSFRDDFSGTALTTTLTGTLTFTNGSTTVTGVGTSFTTQIKQLQYIKQSSDPEADFIQVANVISNTQLVLISGYLGSTTTGATGVVSNWTTTTATGGGSITVSGSVVTIASGTNANQTCQIRSLGDYGPYSGNFYCQISQRLATQTSYVGFQDTTGTRLAMFQFSLTNNTQASLVTSWSGAEIQSTTITLPNGATTASYNTYKVDISMTAVTFSVNGIVVGQNMLHIPGPYDVLYAVTGINNLGVAPASSTSILCDYFTYEDVDRLQVYSSFPGESLAVNGLMQPLYGIPGQALTISMTIATGTAYASAAVSNTTTLYEDVMLFFSVTVSTGVSATGSWSFYGYGSVNGGTTYPEGITGAGNAPTLTSPPNLVLIEQMNVNSSTKTFTMGPISFCRMYGIDRLPAQWGIVAVNNCGVTPTAGSITYQGVNGQFT